MIRAGLLLLVAGCLALLAWFSLAPQPLPAEVIRIDRAAFVKATNAEIPEHATANQPWENRSLPDFWRMHRPNEAGFGWYRVEFDVLYQPDTPWAAFVSFANSALALRLNGVELSREAAFDAVHLAARTSPPHMAILPAPLLKSGTNRLDLLLRVERDINGGLSALEIGPQQWLLPRYQQQLFWRSDLPRALTMAGLVAALFMALLWLRRPREMIYPWFCALALCWSIRALHVAGNDDWLLPLRRPLGLEGNDLFLTASFSLGFALLAITVNRFAARPAPMWERGALALCLLLPLTVAPLGNQVLAPLQPGWYGLAMLFAGWAAATALRLAVQKRHWSYWLILAGIAATTVAGLHDWLVITGRVGFDPTPWLGYGPPVMLATMVTALGGRYFHAFDEAARLNSELEQRVRDKTQELEHHYERIAQLERLAGMAEERDRLMREMHDGVGSQLITTLHALEKGQIGQVETASLLRGCIDDLRLMIDSLDAGQQSMADALANLRFRLEPRLTAAGIRSAWAVNDGPANLPPGTVLQLLRILQEALTNALKHSDAANVQVEWRIEDGAACLRVQDDGSGLAKAATAPASGSVGRGMANMRQRAARIGARLVVSNGPDGGCLVEARLPLAK
ncbi:ATP-binding protein [Ferrovibrio sp.]|uniref:sensor histidine kinase n=1 Tax=Ferrovibrio sp. TaxID=1917215 RepID=UPI0025C5F5FE|nr:ATP-binding protein [Ferrovibrio sp.]MBX3455236.1 hypothetical protein [Ferrovibrio sp.]